MKADAVVIGAGLSGMASALLLARHGRRVTLLEQGPVPGPLLRGFTRRGVRFDTGFHYAGALGPGEPLRALLACLGAAEAIRPVALDPEGFDLVAEPDGRLFPFPCGMEKLRARLKAECPGDGGAVDAYLDGVRLSAEAFPYGHPGARFPGGVVPEVPLTDVTLREFLDARGASARLKRLLEAHTVLYGVPAEEVPFGVHGSIMAGYYQSAWRVEGGGRAVVEALEGALFRAGVTVACGRRATAVRFGSDGALSGVETADGERFGASAVVCTLHPRAMAELIGDDHFRPVYRRRLRALEETRSAMVLHAACDREPPLLSRANVILLGPEPLGPDEGGFDAERRTLFVSGAWAEGDGPGAAGFTALCPTPPGTADAWADSTRRCRPEGYRRFKEEARARLLARLQTAYPEWVSPVVSAEVTTPLTLRDYTAAPVGGLYGAKHRVGQYNPGAATRVAGFCLAGQAVGAPGLFGTLVSAFLACGHLLGHDRLLEDLERTAC